MKRNKHIFITKAVALLLVIVFLLPMNVFAAIPEIVEPQASYFLTSYTSYICPVGYGDLEIWFRVSGTGIMADVGVLTIRVYESTDQVNWTRVKTYLHTDYPAMLDHDSAHHMSYVYFQGTREYYYKALVTIWAGTEDDGDARYIWTGVEQAY